MKRRYFTYISRWYSLSNKLEKEVYAFLRQQERRVIEAGAVDAYKVQIVDKIAEINERHPRCKPITVSWSQFNRSWIADKDYAHRDLYLDLNNFSICHFELHEVLQTDREASS